MNTGGALIIVGVVVGIFNTLIGGGLVLVGLFLIISGAFGKS